MALPAWTYSQLESFETCPKKHYHLKIIRDIVEPPGDAATWGTTVHTALEDRVKLGTELPTGMTQWNPIVSKILAMPGEKHTELQFAITDAFQPAEWTAAWSRGIADLVVLNGKTGAVLDWKTGRRKPTEQLELYAGYMFIHYPQLETVHTGFVWLKEKKLDTAVIKKSEAPAIWQRLVGRYRRIEIAHEKNAWPAKPSGLCKKYCPVTSCEFNGDR